MTNLTKEQEQVKKGVTEIMTLLFGSAWSPNVVASIVGNVLASAAFNFSLNTRASPSEIIDDIAKSAKEKLRLLEECKTLGQAKNAGIIDVISRASDSIN